MNLNVIKEETGSILICKKEFQELHEGLVSFDKTTEPSRIIYHKYDAGESNNICERIDFHQDDADEITTTICEEQAKADIYLLDESDNASKKRLKCPACTQFCTKRSNLRRHIRRAHEGNLELIKQVSADHCIACLLCEQKFSHTIYLKSHLSKEHALEFDEQEYSFADSDEFLEWKDELQKRTDSVYIKQTGEVRRKDGKTYSYFKCNRSGYYKPKLSPTNRKRRMKAYETVKMNSHCTSVMKLVHGMHGELTVFFCATHYGHDGFKECREAVLQNAFINSKRTRKIEDSKMIGPLVTPYISGKHTMNIIDTTCLPDSVTSSMSENSLANIIMESSRCKNGSLLCSEEPCTTSQEDIVVSSFIDNNKNTIPRAASPFVNDDDRNTITRTASPFNNNDRNTMLDSQVYSEHPCSPSDSSAGDTQQHDSFSLPTENCQSTGKRRLVSNLHKLICIIESCQSNAILDLVADGVEELVNRYSPLIDGQVKEENMVLFFDDS